jgi:hypothetical protein
VSSLARRYILPKIVDNVYGKNLMFFRLNTANKKIVRGGTQIEVPLMYSRFNSGGPYRGFDVLNVSASDTVKNGVWEWKQQYVPVSVDGLTLIKTDSPQAIANFISLYFKQAKLEMAENIAYGLFSDGTTDPKEIDGLKGAVDDGGVLSAYAGLTRAQNTYMNSYDDSSTGTLTLESLQSMFGSVGEAGRQPTIILSRQEQYNRYWKLLQANQDFPVQAGGSDELPGLPQGVGWLATREGMHVTVACALAGAYLLARAFVRSPFGRVVAAVRENEMRAQALGYDPRRARLVVFVMSYGLAGLAGGLYAAFARFVSPELFFWTVSGHVLIMVVLGGAGTLVGPMIGAFALSNSMVVIALGLSIGAMFVRSMTIMLVERGTLSAYRYLEHGAFWAILALGAIMLLSARYAIPETVTGLIGAILIAASLAWSMRYSRRHPDET